MSEDVNKILRQFLLNQIPLTDVVGTKIYAHHLPEDVDLPALSFLVRGGAINRYIKKQAEPAFQLDCWGNSPIEARSVYQALFDVLHGIGGYYANYVPVVVDSTTYNILSAYEETAGQDQQDQSIPDYFKVIASFRVKMEIA